MDSPNGPYDADGDVSRYLDTLTPPTPLVDNAEGGGAAPGGNGYGLDVVNPTTNWEMDSHNNNHNNNNNNSSNNDTSNNINNNNDGAGPSGTKNEVGFQWVQPGTLDCSGCNVVSQLYENTNGLYNITIVVHGEAGHFDHLMFVVENTDPALRTEVDIFHFELRGRPLEWVNGLLGYYSIEINPDGSILLQNSLLNIYNRIIGVLTSNGACPSEYAFLYDSDHSQDWFKETEPKNQPRTEFGYVFEDFDLFERPRESSNTAAAPTGPQEHNNRAPGESNNTRAAAPPEFRWVQGTRWVEGPGQSSNAAAAAAARPPSPPPPAQFEWEEAPANVAAPVPAAPASLGPNPEYFSRPARPSIAVQRERVANMTIMDLAPFFHMTAREAAEELNMSTTTLKIVCRRLNLYRWPYRKVKSLDDRIRELVLRVEQMSDSDNEGVFILIREIERLQIRREKLYEFLTRHG